jgi:lipoprotein NlpI
MGVNPVGSVLRIVKHARIALIGLVAIFFSSSTFADAVDLARAGFAAKESGYYARAIQFFDEALLTGNFDKEKRGFLLYSRGVSYEGLSIRDKALVDLDAAIALIPDFPNSYIYRGLIWVYERHYDRAIEDFSRARSLSPNNPLIYNNLAGAYEKKGDLERAIDTYNHALRLNPNYAEAYYNRAAAFLAKGNQDRALSDYDQAIWLRPNFADAFGNRGALRLIRGEFEQAISDFSTAIKLQPRDATFWSNRANAQLSVGDYEKALGDFEQALQLDPGSAAMYLGRGRAKLFAGDHNASAEDFRTAVRIRPANPYPVIWLHIARVHGGIVDKVELTENAAKVHRGAWPSQMLDYYLGKMSPDQIRQAAQLGPPGELAKRSCEAEFFLAESIVHTAEKSQAKKWLQTVSETCKPYDVVYGAALAELKHLLRE